MKVLFCARAYPTLGGVEQWLVDVSHGLSASGLDVNVALSWGERFHRPEDFVAAHAGLSAVRIDGRAGTARGRRAGVRGILARLQPNVVVPVLLDDALTAAVEARRHGQTFRIVYPVHEEHPGVIETIRRYGSFIDCVVCANHLLAELIRHVAGLRDERLAVIRCGVPPVVRERAPSSGGVLRIGYCGRLQQVQKRALNVAAICRELQKRGTRYRLIIAGAGSAEAELKACLGDLSSSGVVEFVGPVSRDYLYRSFYPYLDCLLVTSDWETGPMVAWEAMTHGVVVVTSQYRGLACEGVLRDRQNAMVYPVGDVQRAVECLVALAEDEELRRRLAEAGESTASTFLSAERTTAEWADLVRDLGARPRALGGPLVECGDTAGSRLESLGLPPRVAALVRKVTGRSRPHSYPSEEWPSYPRVPAEAAQRFREAIERLDRPRQSMEPHPPRPEPKAPQVLGTALADDSRKRG